MCFSTKSIFLLVSIQLFTVSILADMAVTEVDKSLTRPLKIS